MKKGISVCMIVRNSSDVLERCLESVKSADEIVILDTGSTDNTAEIAKRYTDKYIAGVYRWADNFAEARNKALEYCTYSHILTIDADEQLMEGGIDHLRTFEGDALNITCISATTGERHQQPRLYYNEPQRIYWQGTAHNYLSVGPEDNSTVYLTYYTNKQKSADPDRTRRILEKWIKENPKDCTRELYYLGKEYRNRGLYKEACKILATHIQHNPDDPEKADSMILLARSLVGVGNINEAITTALAALYVNPDLSETFALLADLSPPDRRLKWKRLSMLATNNNVLFYRPDNRKIITVVCHTGFESIMADLITDLRTLTDEFDIEVLYDIATTGKSIVEFRLQTSNLIHLAGWSKRPETIWQLPLPDDVPVLMTDETDMTAAEMVMKYKQML